MWTSRRGLLAAVALLTLIFLLRSSSPSSPPPESVSYTGPRQPTRAYPPPWRPQPPAQEKESETRTPNAQGPDQPVLDSASKPLREQLRYYFPYEVDSKFPAYIWQTWKYSPASGHFAEHLRPLEASWTEKHPGFLHEVIVDEAALHLVNYLYASVPAVTEAYAAMPKPVLKADFFRYLILLARGGVYSDIDTTALKSTIEWLPFGFDRSTIGLIIGIEADPDRADWAKWYSRRIQFCQWTIQAKPGHPALRDIVATITEETLRLKREGLLKHGKIPKSIVEFTGPAVWTDAIFSYFNNEEYFDFSHRKTNVTYEDFTGLTEHKRVGDVVVLPITSFSPGVQQMGAGEITDPMAFVKHEFEGMTGASGSRGSYL